MKKLHTLILAPVAMAVLLSTATWAAEQPALSDRAYRAVNKAQALITEKKYGEANAKLQEALSGAGERVYDKGVILQTLGFVAAQQEKYGQATKYFADAIATGARAFLFAEYRILIVFAVVLFLVIGLVINWLTAVCFIRL
jgi:tetratricopeptide (TPR) repeat protein